MGVLDQYLDAQLYDQSYEQWMMRFPIIYKLSRELDKYAELFLQLERKSRRFDLEQVQVTAGDEDQSGGGILAAALPRTLGKGANFVVRELIRLGVSDGPHLREHAFVPYSSVQVLLAEMGCQAALTTEPALRKSPVIWDFVVRHIDDPEKATFCRDFDIPLRIVAGDWQLQRDLLGRELDFDAFQSAA
jgi:hypothetical protein